MGPKKPVISEIAYKTYAINEFGMATCFLLEGKKRALLIDAGCGMYDIKSVADELTKLPYDVAISHSHCDHIGSAPLFEEVYVHPADFAAMHDIERINEMSKHYPDMMRPFGTFDTYDISPDDFRAYTGAPKLLPMEDGFVFDLGDRKVEVMLVPGHTVGSVVFFDPSSRILFSGDACNINLGWGATSVTTALRALDRLKTREGEFDRNFNGHIGYGGNQTCYCMPETVLDDCIHICESILNHTAEVNTSVISPSMPPRTFVAYGAVRISFNPNRLIDEGEKPVR